MNGVVLWFVRVVLWWILFFGCCIILVRDFVVFSVSIVIENG